MMFKRTKKKVILGENRETEKKRDKDGIKKTPALYG